MMKEKRRTLITVTVDVDEKISLAWGNPTGPPGIIVDGVTDGRLANGGKVLVTKYGEGKTARLVTTLGYTFHVLRDAGIVKILAPKYFIRSRSGGRIGCFADGREANVLDVLGASLGINDPSWKTMNCWNEDVKEIVSRAERPIGGTIDYSRAYYKRTAEVRRKQARESYHTSRNAPAAVSAVDELIALAKQGGGGGPR